MPDIEAVSRMDEDGYFTVEEGDHFWVEIKLIGDDEYVNHLWPEDEGYHCRKRDNRGQTLVGWSNSLTSEPDWYYYDYMGSRDTAFQEWIESLPELVTD